VAEERFILGKSAALQFNGGVQFMIQKGIRAIFPLITVPQGEDILITLDNISDEKFDLNPGMPIATACILFNPFAENSSHQPNTP